MIKIPIQEKKTYLLSLLLLVVMGSICAWLFFPPPPPPPLQQHELLESTAIETLKRAGFFHRFTQLLSESDILKEVHRPITLYAPTDDAMKKLSDHQWSQLVQNPDLTKRFLKGHLETGEITSQDMIKSDWRTTMNGKKIPVFQQNGVIKLGNARILKTEIRCADGLIHPLDSMLVSPEQLMAD